MIFLYLLSRSPHFPRQADPSNEKSPQQQYQPPTQPFQSGVRNDLSDPKPNADQKNTELQRMVQQLYMAQAQVCLFVLISNNNKQTNTSIKVQLEATEIQRAQTIATVAQKRLEEASNNVRVITTALRSAQEAVANTAQRAQTAQLQLAAHDQLLFTARQKVIFDIISKPFNSSQTIKYA